MHAIRLHRRLESQVLDLPEVASLIGRDVEIIVLAAAEEGRAPPAPARPRRRAGSARGTIEMAADFDAPLAEFAEYMP